MKLSIVIPTITEKLAEACIESIIKYTTLDDMEIIVVYQGKNDWDIDLIKNVKLVKFDEPLGAVRALNEGIKRATGDYILLLNDDCAVLDSPKDFWVNELLKPFEDPKMAVTGPFRMIPRLGASDLMFDKEKLDYGFILFFCAVIPRKIFDEIGLLDEELKCGVDVDFCMKAKEKGYKIAQVPEENLEQSGPLATGSFPFYHKGEGTVHDFYGHQWDKILKDDAKKLNKRYGIKYDNKISILITVFGDMLAENITCLESIYSNTDLSNVEIIVVANAVSDRVDAYLSKQPQIKYYRYDEPLGCSGALNRAIQNSSGNIKVILNQDVVILGKDWLKILITPFKDKSVGQTGPLIRPIAGIDYSYAHGFCMAISNDVIKKIGEFDVAFNPGGFEDLDYSVRIQEAGYRLVQVPENIENKYGCKYGFEGAFPIFHKENHSNWMKQETHDKNHKYFFNKYKKDMFVTRDIIIPDWPVAQKKYELMMVQEFLKNYKIKTVLEVGTYRGGTAMLWAHFVAPLNGRVYCADLKFDWGEFQDHGYLNPQGKTYRRQVYNDSEYEKYITEIQGDTHNISFVEKVSDIVGQVDFMFIDGDHSYEGVKQDFKNYARLCKNGGYVMFHDISDGEYHNKMDCHVDMLWKEIKNVFPSWEFFDNNEYPGCPAKSMGIGVIQMNDDSWRRYNAQGPQFTIHEVDSTRTIASEKVTAYISTKDRYFTTLPMAIAGIIGQTVKPDEFILIDDGEQKDLRGEPVYQCLFKMLDESSINWKVLFGQKKGQVANHQMMLTEARNDIIWRVDDDNFPEANVLDVLLSTLLSDKKIGAVASRSVIPGNTVPRGQASSLIGDLNTKPNIQWAKFSGCEDVDHLHNTFLFRKEAAKVGYHMGLSPVGHREETIFSFGMKLHGWRLIVVGDIITWHLRQPAGGIRTFNDGSMYAHDEEIFKKWIKAQTGKELENTFVAVLDSGLGDHYDFLSILPEIKVKHKNIILATCYPDVFKDEPVLQISIAEAKARYGNIDNFNIYKFLIDNRWTGHIKDAYRKMYLE